MTFICVKEFEKAAQDVSRMLQQIPLSPVQRTQLENIRVFCLNAMEKPEFKNADMRMFKDLAIKAISNH